jgi:uncharacterized protein (TIGR02231 family)
MKHTFFLAAAIVCSLELPVYAAQEKLVIERATVFLSGAELTNTARVFLNKGENEVVFTNVAGDVNSQSIIVNAGNGAVVQSATFQNNYLATENVSPKVKEIKDSIDLIKSGRLPLTNKLTVIAEQIAILQANRKVGGDNTGMNVAELQKMLDLVNNRMTALLGEKNKTDEQLKKTDERLANLQRQLDEEQKKGYQPGGQLLVKFFAKEAGNSNITISYVVPNAGWSPVYDIWADDAKSPVKIYYKANVYQNSGVKWDNVRLKLSTGNPTEGMQMPTLDPWYLSLYQAVAVTHRKALLSKSANGAAAPMAATSAMDDAGVKEESSINEYVTVDNSGVNTEFDIDLPYNIPTDGQQHLVAVKKYEAPATFQHFAIPKKDKDAFLQARITNWEDLNLLPGTTNIFYEGTFIGSGTIDPSNTKDTMSISLGRDKKIVVKKERDKKLRSVKTIGTNVRESFTYNITVRNTRKETVTIEVQDQQPVSNDKDIVIEDKETGNSDYNETTGLMKWTVTLKPNETKTLNFGYTLRYPKGKTLMNN